MTQTAGQHEDDWREVFVTQIFRLFKTGVVHAIDNKATQQTLDRSHDRLSEILKFEDDIVTVLFSGDDIFVNGKPLNADRSVYENLLEFADLLGDVGFNEIGIKKGVQRQDLEELVRRFRELRESTGSKPNEVKPTPRVRLRKVDVDKLDDDEEDDLSVQEQVTRIYSASIVTLRRFLNEIKEQEFRLLQYVKRISQRLVPLTDSGSQYLLAVTGMSQTRDEPAGISANSGILAMLMGRRITDDFQTLQRICFAGMVTDLGRPRAAGLWERDNFSGNVIPNLNLAGKERLALSNALILLSNSRVRQPALQRATVAYEAGWLENKLDIGLPYDKKERPSLEAFIISAARRYCDLMALDPSMKERRTPREAFNQMTEEADLPAEKSVLRLLMSTVGYYRRGAIVETTAGWQGVVVKAGESLAEFPRPVVRFVYDPSGNSIDPRDVDLGTPEVDLERFGIVAKSLDQSANRRLKEVAMEVKKASDKAVPTPEAQASQSVSDSSSRAASASSAAAASSPEESGPASSSVGGSAPSSGLAEESGSTSAADTSAESGSSDAASGLANLGVDEEDDSQTSTSSSTDSGSDDGTAVVDDLPEIRGLDTDDGQDSVEAGGDRVEISSSPGGSPSVSSSSGKSSSAAETSDASSSSTGADISAGPSADDSNGDGGSRERTSSLDAMAGDLAAEDPGDSDLSPGDSGRTRQVSAEQSRELLGDELEDAPGGDSDGPASDEGTRQVNSEESKELLSSFVDGPDDETSSRQSAGADDDDGPSVADLNMGPAEDPDGGDSLSASSSKSTRSSEVISDDSPNDSRLGDLASDIDENPPVDQSNEHVSSEKSRELIDNYVEGADEEGSESDARQRGDSGLEDLVSEESGGEEEATKRVDAEDSRELLSDFVDSESEAEEEPARTSSSRESAEIRDDGDDGSRARQSSEQILQSFVEEDSQASNDETTDVSSDDGGGLAIESETEAAQREEAGFELDSGSDAIALDGDDGGDDGGDDLELDRGRHDIGASEVAPPDDDTGSGEDAFDVSGDDSETSDERTRQVSAEESAQVLDQFVDDTPDGGDEGDDDAVSGERTRQVSAEESAQVLDQFVDDAPSADGDDDDDAVSGERTRQVSAEESAQVLDQFVDDSPGGDQQEAGGDNAPSLGDLAGDDDAAGDEVTAARDESSDDSEGLDEDTSPEEIEPTQQLDREESRDVLSDYIDGIDDSS